MLVTYNWLKEYVDFDMPPSALADLLTMLGLEVEGIESVGAGLDEVVVAVVEEKLQHPNADKLSLCKVNNGREILSVVCGAQNFKAGDFVALAQVGAVLPGNFKIKRSKIRGEESCGMLCSEKELGLSQESAGIIILPQHLTLGVPLMEALGLKDTVFEIGLTPNRADCLSVIGIAREIAAKLGRKVEYPKVEVAEIPDASSDFVSVSIEDPDLCPRYTARFITDCKIGPSPPWLVNRLRAVGIRSINNVVDVTNYVMMEFGHPLHAFDYDLLHGGQIIVRRAGDLEKFTTLDGQERELYSSDLTIRDGERGVALAGIMGGENSEIVDGTSKILLESAYFHPSAIRRTAKRLGLHTESSHRFERGADIDVLPTALNRAASLISELASGKVTRGIVDVYPAKLERRTVRLRISRTNEVLGTDLSADTIANLLCNLELTVNRVEPNAFDVGVPLFRVDLEREIDLIEEVARLNGYDAVPPTAPRMAIFANRSTRRQCLEKRLKDLLVSEGLSEAVTYSFISPTAFDKISLGSEDRRRKCIPVMNPLTEEQSVMRTTLLPGLLETASRNNNFRTPNIRLFEMRRVYFCSGDSLPEEPMFIAGLLSGANLQQGWNQTEIPIDFFDVKGIIENLMDRTKIFDVVFENKVIDSVYHPGKAAVIMHNDLLLGSLGELHPAISQCYGLDKEVFYFELDFEKLVKIASQHQKVTPPSRYPDTFRDIAMIISDETEGSAVLGAIRKNKVPDLQNVEIFDVYKGPNIPDGQKSVAVRVFYGSDERTLNDEEVNKAHQRLKENLIKQLNVVIR